MSTIKRVSSLNLLLLTLLCVSIVPAVVAKPKDFVTDVLQNEKETGSGQSSEESFDNFPKELWKSLMDPPEYHFPGHHDYEKMTGILQGMATTFSKHCSLFSIGKTTLGMEQWVLKISSDKNKLHALKPQFKLIGNIHGNEVVGKEVLLNFAYVLLSVYEKTLTVADKKRSFNQHAIANFIDNTDIYIIPSLNPEGYEIATKRNEQACDGIYGRGSSVNEDLNRNFPDQFYKNNNDPSVWEKETVNILNWLSANHFVLSANLHGGAVVAVYPYDNSPTGSSVRSVSPDTDYFERVAKTYSFNHPDMYKGTLNCGYADEVFKDGITNGAEWYSLNGGMQDWNYLHTDCFEILIEMACCKFPAAEKLKQEFEDHYYSLFAFATQVHMGAKGFVLDEKKKPIIGAEILVSGIDHVIHSGFFGDFYRLLVPGSYTITAKAPGKFPISKTVVVHERHPAHGVGVDFANWATRVDFILPSDANPSDSTLEKTKNYVHKFEKKSKAYYMYDFNVYNTTPLTNNPPQDPEETRKMPYTDLKYTEFIAKTGTVKSSRSLLSSSESFLDGLASLLSYKERR
eukprot:Nk52_evm34s1360 gene=Nk52_evmTU34s1360